MSHTMKMQSINQIFQKNKELDTKVSVENIEDLAKLFNVNIPSELTEAIELVDEFRDHCGRLASELDVYIDTIACLYDEMAESLDETPKYFGRTIPDAVRNLRSIAKELEDLSHGS